MVPWGGEQVVGTLHMSTLLGADIGLGSQLPQLTQPSVNHGQNLKYKKKITHKWSAIDKDLERAKAHRSLQMMKKYQ